MKRTDPDLFDDYRVVHSEGMALIWAALRKSPRGLMPRDVVVLFRIVDCTNYRTGKAKITVNQLAEDVAMQPSNVSLAISRLKKEMLVATVRDPETGGRYFLPNPYLTSSSRQKQAYLWQLFQQARE
jgi:DNA-binding MarR family transcriptional regulator